MALTDDEVREAVHRSWAATVDLAISGLIFLCGLIGFGALLFLPLVDARYGDAFFAVFGDEPFKLLCCAWLLGLVGSVGLGIWGMRRLQSSLIEAGSVVIGAGGDLID